MSSINAKWWATVTVLLSLVVRTYTQTIAPSNGTQDLYPSATSPRFILNGTQLGDIPVVRLAPLGHYAEISHNAFEQVHVEGHIVNVDASNANDITDTQQFSYVSCDPEAYTGNLGATEVFRIVVNSPRTSIIILYSVTSDHCVATDLNNLPTIGGILTTTDTMMAKSLADLGLTADSQGSAAILPDLNSYTNTSRNNGGWSGNGSLGQSPTTAVAMIILYSITGIITALFVVIIISGAVRAHRHPERYGPRNIIGRGRQSRAKGIARAMLETLPIVKFGDHEDLPKKSVDGSADIEMNATGENSKAADANAEGANKSVTGAGAVDAPSTSDAGSESAVPTVIPANNPDGTDAEGHLGCSICTEDFKKGEELRVLPCNHKFHPDCVDPWLLNVSGTCPLCRIDLRPATAIAGEEDNGAAGSRRNSAATAHDGQLPPPLAEVVDTNTQSAQGGRRETVANLRHLASGTREERIAALRRLRQERLGSNSQRPSEAERHGLTSRFRDRFRIRTERRETTFDPQRRRSSANIPSTFFG